MGLWMGMGMGMGWMRVGRASEVWLLLRRRKGRGLLEGPARSNVDRRFTDIYVGCWSVCRRGFFANVYGGCREISV